MIKTAAEPQPLSIGAFTWMGGFLPAEYNLLNFPGGGGGSTHIKLSYSESIKVSIVCLDMEQFPMVSGRSPSPHVLLYLFLTGNVKK